MPIPSRRVEVSCEVAGDQPTVSTARHSGHAGAAVPRSRRQPPRAELHRRGLDREDPRRTIGSCRCASAAASTSWSASASRARPARASLRCGRPSTARRFGSSTCRTSIPAAARCRRRWRARSSSRSPSSISIVDLQLIPLALTPDQCREYRLPRTPIKETERRKDKFEQIFGVGATELDALEALHPGELARLLEAETRQLARRRSQASLQPAASDHAAAPQEDRPKRIREKHADEIEALEQSFNEITDQLAEIASEFDEWEEEAGELWQTIAAEIEEERPDLSDVEVPRSEAPGETDRFVLFDSRRDYFTQMDAYNAWRDGDEHGEERVMSGAPACRNRRASTVSFELRGRRAALRLAWGGFPTAPSASCSSTTTRATRRPTRTREIARSVRRQGTCHMAPTSKQSARRCVGQPWQCERAARRCARSHHRRSLRQPTPQS